MASQGLPTGRKITGKAREPCYYIPFTKNIHFTGHATILNALEDAFFGQEQIQRMALAGLGGVGKTQIALHFAYQVKDKWPEYSIFWVPVLSNEGAEHAHAEIAKKLGLQKESEDDDVKRLVCQHLSSAKAGKWLLIVDNADDHELFLGSADKPGLEEYLPQSENGMILLTTRSTQVAGEFAQYDVIEVKQMNNEEAMSLLETSLVQKQPFYDDAVATELLTYLTFLPLAITQAAAYLNQTRAPLQTYLSLLKNAENDTRVLEIEFRDNNRYRDSQNAVGTTWIVSFRQIQKSDELAVKLLSFMSCIAPKAIPQSILPNEIRPIDLQSAIGTLCSYAFLVRRGQSNVFDMHSLVHVAMRGWLKKQGLENQVTHDAICHLAARFPTSSDAHHDVRREYLPHAIRLLSRNSRQNVDETYRLIEKVGASFKTDRKFKEAVKCFEEVYLWKQGLLPKKDHSRLASEHMLASAYLNTRQIKDAIKIFEHVVEVQRETLDEKNHSRLTSEHGLASAYLADRRIEDAIEILKHVVEVRKETLDKEDHSRLISEHSLAVAYLAARLIKDAGFDELTALQTASEGGHLEVVEKLLAAGVDADSKDTDGRTALQVACEAGHLEVVEKLLAAGADADSKDTDGRTAFQVACEAGHLEIVKKLLAAGADADSKDTDGRTPLSCAAENGDEVIVKLLLATGKVDVHSKDTEGRTSLSWAAEKGFQAVVELLSAQNSDNLRSLSGDLSTDTGSDVSNDSSVFSISSSVPSTTPSSLPGSENVDNAAAEHLAYLLSEDLFLRPLYSQALKAMDKDRFFRNHDRLLKKFMIELRCRAEDDMVIQVVRVLRNQRQRERVTTQIYHTFQPDTANTNRKGMRDFLDQKEDRKYRLKVFFEQRDHERGTAGRDNVPEANSSGPAAADVKVEEEIHENEESGSAPDEEVEDEDEGEETEDESEDAPNASQRLDLVVDFITSSPPFEAFKSNLHYFVNPPTTIKEAIGSNSIKALKQLLRNRFDLLATGEYSWLQELNDMGLDHDEMADLLFQQATDSPWIYFEPGAISPTEIKIGHHLHGCVHQLNLSNKPKPGSTASHQGSFQTGDWSDYVRTIQELCGLGGIAPKTRCLEKWNGSVTFEEDHSTACVSYAHQDEQVVFSRVANALRQFCIAIGHAQSAGLCCDSFTILKNPGRHPNDRSSLIEVCRIDFHLAVTMLDELEQLFSAKDTPDFGKPRSLEVVDILLEGASIGPSPETLTEALHLYSLAVQILCLGFLSYSQAHVGPLRPFFLDTLVTKVRLLGIETSSAPYQYIDAGLKELTCFGNMVEGPVLAFSVVTPKPSTPSPIDLRSGFDLLTSAQDLVDTWGPGQFVVPDGKKHPSAIRIGGGFVYLCTSGQDSGKFHWSRTVTSGLFCYGEFDLRRKIVIGARVTVNDACGLDESSCRASLSGHLQPLGTSLPGWELKEVQVGGQIGNYGLVQANASYHMFPGQTLKKKRLDVDDGELILFLEELWGVQMSLCTAVARRVLLHEMIADLLPVFARRLTSGDECRLWKDLESHRFIIENFRSGKLLGWVQELPPPAHNLVLKLVRGILNTLQDTGLDRNGKALMVAWPYGNDSCHGCRIACEGESSWARALADSHDSATFAYISAACLETEEIKCSGKSWQWKNTIPLLETAVTVEMTSTSMLTETLQNERIYSFRMLQNPLLVKARKPNTSGMIMLVEKKSKIPAQVRQRWNEIMRTHKVLREKRGAHDRAELVVVLSIQPT
ncbi:unnamed protein product [Fusarium graminearum]|nr:unnamed protein product [Fusarium graminearum]